MKKLLCLFLTALFCFGTAVHAADYMYFYSGEMSVEIDASSMSVLNGCTYATDRQGNLYGTHIFSKWLLMENAPKNCRIISTRRKDENKLLLFSEGTLYVTYDGYTYTEVETFTEDTVVRFINGLYTAMHKTDSGYQLRYSFDGLSWYNFSKTLTSPMFSVLHVNETLFLLKNAETLEGNMDILFSATAPEDYTVSPYLTYDYETDSFSELTGNGELLYAAKTSENLFLYVLHNEHTYTLLRLNADRSLHSQSFLVAGKNNYELYVLNNTVCLAKDGKSLNFLNLGDAQWHQVSDDIAFPILKGAYHLYGDFFFDGGYTQTYYCRNADVMPTAASGIEVIKNGYYIAFDSAPQLINDRTMVPIRAIAEALGCTVAFDDLTKQITIQRSNGIVLVMTLGSTNAKIIWTDGNSAQIPLDAAPVIVDGRTLVPLRFVSESLELKTDWINETQTVVLQ